MRAARDGGGQVSAQPRLLPWPGARELRYLSDRLIEALQDALRIAESRGGRLPGPSEREGDGPTQTSKGPNE
ncbi:hypothetical protein DNK48_31950 [Streptomyces malaysiensis subsp. malaysiensis]|nr:hypothetical protein DNK48_31950 [Streptomyces malaysiensis]